MTALAMPQQDPQTPRKLLLVDGYGFVFRAYHSMPPLTSPDGTPVGAVFGFTNMLFKLISAHEADYIALILDAGSKTFRNEIYTGYKANRPPAPEDLIPQFPLIRTAAEALKIATVELAGYEADDLIATYTRLARERGDHVRIVSSDKDLMQLIGEGVEMYDPMKSRVIGPDQVQEKFGVSPDKVLDVLSLMGDASDNIPGVPGIGPKTAAELIATFGDLDSILARAGEIKQNKRRETLIENADAARMSRRLISLCDTVPVPLPIDDMAPQEIHDGEFLAFAKKYGFKSIVSKLERQGATATASDNTQSPTIVRSAPPSHPTRYTLIENIESLKQWLNKQGEVPSLSIYMERDKTGSIIGMALCSGKSRACYLELPGNIQAQQTNLFGEVEQTGHTGITISDALETLQPILRNPSIVKISDNVKLLLKAAGATISPVDDVSMMSYLLGAGLHGHSLPEMAEKHLGLDADSFKIKLTGLEKDVLRDYGCRNADIISQLHTRLKQRLFNDKMLTLYERVEKPLIAILADMELAGIKVDITKLRELSEDFAKRIDILEGEIFTLAGRDFNVGSPKQLGEVLFEEMGLQNGKKSKKSGAYSTGAEILEELHAQGHEIAGKVLQWRQLSKLKSTYTDALAQQTAKDGRIHTHFAMQATSTGRLSSHDPNLQNIPIRTEEGNKIREAFIAEDGCKLIAADYSQIELRLLADMANINTLREAFKNGHDIHAATASQMFGVPLDRVDSELRRKAKMINFGIIYGISAFGLAHRLGISRSEAGDYIKQYFIQYPGIEAYMKRTIEFAREHGYVVTQWGRKCCLRDINSKNPGLRNFSERAAINAPLQGSAADIIKKAMVQLPSRLRKAGLNAKILLQVHDELVLEAPETQAEQTARIVKEVMENTVRLSIPLTVDVGVGDNWKQIH